MGPSTFSNEVWMMGEEQPRTIGEAFAALADVQARQAELLARLQGDTDAIKQRLDGTADPDASDTSSTQDEQAATETPTQGIAATDGGTGAQAGASPEDSATGSGIGGDVGDGGNVDPRPTHPWWRNAWGS